jgi:hypothetical protein
MSNSWRSAVVGFVAAVVAVGSVGALAAPPARAQFVCSSTRVVVVRRQASGITPTILDSIAFPLPLARPAPSVAVKKVVTCPAGSTIPRVVTGSPVLTAPPAFTVFPTAIGPPADPSDPSAPIAHPASPPHLAAAAGPPAIAPHDTIRQLAAHPQAFDHQIVTVTGIVKAYTASREGHGAPPTLFELADGNASVLVAVWGQPYLRAGTPVRVTGAFYTAAPFPVPAGARSVPVVDAQVVTPAR